MRGTGTVILTCKARMTVMPSWIFISVLKYNSSYEHILIRTDRGGALTKS